jgi:uncharacterized integral membrane protein
MLILKIISGTIVFILLLIFASKNSEYVTLNFGSVEPVRLQLFIVILGALVIGMVIVWFISLYEKVKLVGQLRVLKKEKKRIEGELNSLRKMPIVESNRAALPEGSQTGSIKRNT